MNNTYHQLITQTYDFPRFGLKTQEGNLHWNEMNLMPLVEEFQSPMKLSYLPSISQQIQKARHWFNEAISELNYQGKYHYSYCTKSSHFSFVLEEVLKSKTHLELSSAFDLDLVQKLLANGSLQSDIYLLCNGYKPENYTRRINEMMAAGYSNIIPILDHTEELKAYTTSSKSPIQLGIRIAAEEEPNFEFYTSRLGIRYSEIVDFYVQEIRSRPQFRLKMLHFFINTGIKDSVYYWSELRKVLRVYCELKRVCPDLSMLNIGGGLSIPTSLGFEFDNPYMIREIISLIQSTCQENGVEVPDIFTEFGNFTVAQSGALVFEVIGQKRQNDRELWYMIDNSLMTTMPDIYGINQRFILLPLNGWNRPYQRVNIGGLSCDGQDYYNSEVDIQPVNMPVLLPEEPLYIGFFHVGAYQDALSGYGGIKHCLLPTPKHVLIQQNENKSLSKTLFSPEQDAESMLRILGY